MIPNLDMEQLKKELKPMLEERDAAISAEHKANVDAAIEARVAKVQAELDAKYARHSLPGSGDATHKGEKFSFAKVYRAVATGNSALAPFELEMSNAIRSKAMSFGTDTAGGFLVPNEVLVDQVIPLLYPESVVLGMGATQLTGLEGRAPVQIPRVSGGTTAYWVGEAASITASDMALTQMTLTPHGLAALTVISDLLQQTGPGVESMIKADMARKLGLAIDLGALAGSGAGGEPTGVLTATGVNTTTISDPATYDQLLAAISEVRADNALSGKLGWVCSNADMLEFEQMKDAQVANTNVAYQQLQRRTLLNEDGTKLLGYPVKVSTQLTDGQIIFGNWADMVVAQWGGLRIDMTNALGFQTAQSHIRALTYVDVGLRHAESFCRDD